MEGAQGFPTLAILDTLPKQNPALNTLRANERPLESGFRLSPSKCSLILCSEACCETSLSPEQAGNRFAFHITTLERVRQQTVERHGYLIQQAVYWSSKKLPRRKFAATVPCAHAGIQAALPLIVSHIIQIAFTTIGRPHSWQPVISALILA